MPRSNGWHSRGDWSVIQKTAPPDTLVVILCKPKASLFGISENKTFITCRMSAWIEGHNKDNCNIWLVTVIHMGWKEKIKDKPIYK